MKFEITGKGQTATASLSQVKTLIKTLKDKDNCIGVVQSHRKDAVSDWAKSFRSKWTFKFEFQNEAQGTFYQTMEVYIKGVL